MNNMVERKTVDLSAFPDLVVIYLGMRVNALTGVKTLFGFGPPRESKQAIRFYTGWVKRCGASQARGRSLSGVDPIATTLLQRRE